MKLSILTATYNREDLLGRLYKSIKSNLIENMDVEWLIMDDGSTDNTENLVENFEECNHLEIKYYKQVNQGKMQAINNLMEHVSGELVMDCDSDDFFVRGAFKSIYEKSENLLNDEELYALVFLKNENQNQLSGNRFVKENEKTTMFSLYFKEGILGEKIIVFKTSIRKKYKHELMENEKFITEARMYHKMDLSYGIKCFNIVLVEGEYLDTGYTSNITKTFKESPKGYFQYFNEILNRNEKGIKFGKRIYAIKHFILFKELCKYKKANINNLTNKILYYILLIPGKIAVNRRFK